MNPQSDVLKDPEGLPRSTANAARLKTPKRSNASRWFGYDIFISFALGPPPRGTHSYASDLARRLRELDFTVFFSEDEMPPGEELDSNLRTALHRSKALVVIVNRATLEYPRWIRKEVEEYRARHPGRSIIPINIDGALQDAKLMASAQQWLGFADKIWLDETRTAVENGIATEAVLNRLALAPSQAKANVRWRWVIRAIGIALAVPAILLGFGSKEANDNAAEARTELRRATALRLAFDSQAIATGARTGGDERALLQLLASERMEPNNEAEGGLLDTLIEKRDIKKIWGGEEAPVTAVAFSPDSTRFVSGNNDGKLRLWDAHSGQPIGAPMLGHENGVTSVAFSPDGTRIISGSVDKTLRLWDAHSGQPIGKPMQGHQKAVYSVAFSPDGTRIVSGGDDKMLRLWDANSGQPIGAPLHGHRWVSSVAFSPDGTRIASGGGENMRLWDAKTSQPIGPPLLGHEGPVSSVAFNHDGTRIVSGGWDLTLRLWDVDSGRPIGAPLQGHKQSVRSVAFSPDGTRIASGGNVVRLWPGPKVWPELLCAKLTRNMSHAEWRTWVSPTIDYVAQCPGLPLPMDKPIKQSTLTTTGEANWIFKNWIMIASLALAAMLTLLTYRVMINRRTSPIPAARPISHPSPPSPPSSPSSSVGPAPKQIFPSPGKGRPAAFLFCVEGPTKGHRYPIDHAIYRIGADDTNELQLSDDFVSRKHACVKYDSGNLYLSDSGSRNGTYLNESPLQQTVPLNPGDRIRVGKTILTLVAAQS